MRVLLTSVCLGLLPTIGLADELTIASWNIANLASPGEELRGYARTEAQYSDIRDTIVDLDADVLAFQEIGSIRALEAILPEGYAFRFETRCYENSEACEDDAGDIFTAIAIREDIEHAFFQIDELSILHQDECGNEPRPVRGAVGVDIVFNGQRMLIPSLHLKAACADDDVSPGTEDDCAVQREQLIILRDWMDRQPEDAVIILTGDFNRELLESGDSVRQEFFGDVADTGILPADETRACWGSYDFDFGALSDEARARNPAYDEQGARPFIFTPSSSDDIDFFVIDGLPASMSLVSDQIELPTLYEFTEPGSFALQQCDGSLLQFSETDNRVMTFGEAYPSDHCPIVLSFSAE